MEVYMKKTKNQKNKKSKKQKIKKTKNQKNKKTKNQKNESFVFFTPDKVECVSCPFRGSKPKNKKSKKQKIKKTKVLFSSPQIKWSVCHVPLGAP